MALTAPIGSIKSKEKDLWKQKLGLYIKQSMTFLYFLMNIS